MTEEDLDRETLLSPEQIAELDDTTDTDPDDVDEIEIDEPDDDGLDDDDEITEIEEPLPYVTEDNYEKFLPHINDPGEMGLNNAVAWGLAPGDPGTPAKD